MQQYLNLLKQIKEKGTWKEPAREGMPRTLSLFGYQMRFNLQEGFPLVTTKPVSFKNIVVELLWFMKGDTNIKFLVDNGCNIWNEDAYNYYKKMAGNSHTLLSFENFISYIKKGGDYLKDHLPFTKPDYILGDCGKQYGWLWRSWDKYNKSIDPYDEIEEIYEDDSIDQLKDLIEGLKSNPMSRRHIITAWNPATLDDMALNACHSFVQFNCRPLRFGERIDLYAKSMRGRIDTTDFKTHESYDKRGVPKYYLDCKFTMRSNDAVIGNCYNVASYALLTHIIAKICNMEVGDLIADLGDVHIYENHLDAVNEQLEREPKELPKLDMSNLEDDFEYLLLEGGLNYNYLVERLDSYNPHPKLKNPTPLSTGLK